MEGIGMDESVKRSVDVAEWRARRAGPPGILTINGVEFQQFRLSKTWRVPTPDKIRVARENKARRTNQPRINLDLITRNKQYYPTTNVKTIHAKCEFIPNAAATASSNFNTAQVQGRSLLKRPCGHSSDQIVIQNLNLAADLDGTIAAEGESSGIGLENLNPHSADEATDA